MINLEATHEPAQVLQPRGPRRFFKIPAGFQCLGQCEANSLQFCSRRRRRLFALLLQGACPRDFIQAYGDRLSQIHRRVLLVSWDSHQPLAVAKVVVRKAALFRTKQDRDPATCERPADESGPRFECPQAMSQFSVPRRRGSDYERAISHRFRDAAKFFSASKQWRSADRGTCLAESQFVGIHYPQALESEIA